MKSHILLASGFLVALTALPASAVAPEDDFIARFGGSWSGPGVLMTGEVPIHANCEATGQPGQNQIALQGSCSVAVASMRIAANVTYDPATGRYSGTYTGAKVGTARVSGKRSGDVVHLTVNWPRPVRGQTEARLVIENAGNGQLRIVLNEYIAPDGGEMTTHELVLSRV